MYKNFHRIYLCVCENKTVDNSKTERKNTWKLSKLIVFCLCVVVLTWNVIHAVI